MSRRDDAREPPGTDPFAELGGSFATERIRAVLDRFPSEDRSTERLRAATGGSIDLAVHSHRTALLAWLRSWGCRHLRVADTGRSSRALSAWWRAHGSSMPGPGRSLVAMTARELDAAGVAYGALAAAPAAVRSAAGGDVRVSFGETAAAKALHAIRPLAFAPWDEPIRVALGLAGGGGLAYRAYLERVALALRALSARLEVPVPSVPSALGRPGSSPPRLVDEYLWMRVNPRYGAAPSG